MSKTRNFSLDATSQTAIDIIPLSTREWCHNCLKSSALELIDTQFLSQPLVKCARCSSVIQSHGDALRLEVKGIMKKRREATALADALLEVLLEDVDA